MSIIRSSLFANPHMDNMSAHLSWAEVRSVPSGGYDLVVFEGASPASVHHVPLRDRLSKLFGRSVAARPLPPEATSVIHFEEPEDAYRAMFAEEIRFIKEKDLRFYDIGDWHGSFGGAHHFTANKAALALLPKDLSKQYSDYYGTVSVTYLFGGLSGASFDSARKAYNRFGIA